MNSKTISDVTVSKVSLLTKDNDPAVEMASNKYAIFKMTKKPSFITKATELYNRLTLSKSSKQKIDQIIEKSTKIMAS